MRVQFIPLCSRDTLTNKIVVQTRIFSKVFSYIFLNTNKEKGEKGAGEPNMEEFICTRKAVDLFFFYSHSLVSFFPGLLLITVSFITLLKELPCLLKGIFVFFFP